MAKNNGSVLTCGKGIDLDSDPVNQSPNTRRFTLNGLVGSMDGKKYQLGMDMSNYHTTTIPDGFYVIGEKYIGDDTIAVILTNPKTSKTEIGLIDKSDRYITHVNTGTLTTKLTKQCDIIYRLRRGNQRIIYWVDADNNARTYNFDKPYNYYDNGYAAYIRNGGDPTTYTTEKWDGTAFDLIKTYKKIPSFEDEEIIETGSILPGSYNFAVQLVDEDLNPTNWITSSNTINIYNDTTTMNYERIRGSRNIQTDSQTFSRASKTIKLTMGNLDTSYPYYRIAIIRSASNSGEPDKVLLSELFSTYDDTFIYTGNDASLTDGTLEDVMIDKEVIYKPHHIEQLENRVILAYSHGKGIDWCTFQRYASKIKSDLTTKEVLLNTIDSDANVKNAKSTFMFRGYMPGEVYSFGVVYIFKDGYISPVFHIPGKNATVVNDMAFHEIDAVYLNTHNCAMNNYWGADITGKPLIGEKVRHHKFPFRKDVGKPLISKSGVTTPITRYRLRVVITLNPLHTPTPEYPKDTVTGDPLVIGANYVYKLVDLPSTSSRLDNVRITDMGIVKTIYDDTNELDPIFSGGAYGEVDPVCQLGDILDDGNSPLLHTFTYDSYILTTSNDIDTAEIFGIEFSNIEKPHPDVIGCYIVRNERLEEDRIIVDNAIFGPMTQHQQYRSFGLITPKQFYTATNCGTSTAPPGTPLEYYKKGIWFFNPEFEYYNKKTGFDRVEIEGKYSEALVSMPTIGDNDTACTFGLARGVGVQDVQAGTSFNGEVNTGEDSDGFDLLVGYRNTDMIYAIESGVTLPDKLKEIYLNAAASQDEGSETMYNVSVDNKIGMYLTEDDIDIEELHETATNKNNLLYGSLVKNNTSSYSNFINRPYYKEHNNLIEFGNNSILSGVRVYNGDAQISAMHFVSSVYYDTVVAQRDKKTKVWQIVAGAILVVAGVVLSVVGVGVAIGALGVALIGLAVSMGVSLAVAGLKFEQYKKMINTDYSKGLKETVVDGGVYETIRDTIAVDDDTIRWFSDRVSNIYMESTVAFGLRSGLTAGATDFVDAPKAYDEYTFRDYLVNKFTVIDRDQGSGRLYKGYAGAEVYDMNLDYLRFNKQKIFTHLGLEYDCCADAKEVFPLRRWYSEQAFQEERVDNYRVFLPNNYSDMEGEHGEITGMYRLGINLFIQTREAVWQQPANMQERVTNEIVSFIGTGSFLAIPPRKIVDDSMGSAGTDHKWANLKTPFGVMSISEVEHMVHLHSQKLEHLGEGMSSYFYDELRPFLSKQLHDNLGVDFMHNNNPANPNGCGYTSVYDRRFNRFIISKKDYLLLPDKLAILGVIDKIPPLRRVVGGSFPIPHDDEPIPVPTVDPVTFNYCLQDGRFYLGTLPVSLTNRNYFEDKAFTLSYSFLSRSWVGWHSYLPNYYIRGKNNYYSFIGSNLGELWKHNITPIGSGSYRTYYGVEYPFIIELVLTNVVETAILKDIKLETIAYRYDNVSLQTVPINDITFNKIVAYNGRQSTGEQELVIKLKDADYLSHRIVKQSGKIGISKEKRDWYLNEFRDMVGDYDESLFTREWTKREPEYFIDKVLNPLAISQAKDWSQLQVLRDKYVIFRFRYDKTDDVNLIMYFSIPSESPSI